MTNNPQLAQVLDHIAKTVEAGKLPVVIFDLDDTLFSTAMRNFVIIREFAADHADDYPKFGEAAGKLTLADMTFSAKDALIAAGLSEDDPSIAGPKSPFYQFWGPSFFSDTYAALDLPYPGAVDFVTRCHDAGALVYYLTGRGVSDHGMSSGMEQGTARSLTTRGFPFWTGRCELELKLVQGSDPDYKKKALKMVDSLRGEVVATFDNEPPNVDVFLGYYPEAMNFWVKTVWNPKDPMPGAGALVIKDFKQ